MTAAETFADWALSLRLAGVPDDVTHAASRHLLDGLGCAVAAARLGAAPYATALASSERGGATVIGLGHRVPAHTAALANGILMHALDYDDTHTEALVHATAAVFPAAFAVGEQVDASGEEVLAACIAGYETVLRLGAAVTHGFHARGFHATSVCGVFAAALAAAKLMGLSVDQTTNALGIAGSAAAGSLEFLSTGAATKQLHPGLASMNGIVAARLAAAGAEGPASIFEGDYGLFRSYVGASVAAQDLTEGLGTRWETTRITIKPYPACQLSHASLDALSVLRGQLDDPGEVTEIRAALPSASLPIVCEPAEGKRRPRTPYEGKFSLQYSLASLFVDGSLGLDSFSPAALERPDVLAVADRVTFTERPFDGAPADAPGVVDVVLTGGALRGFRVERSRGGPDWPLSDEEVVAKFLANFGSDRAASVTDRMLHLSREPAIGPLLAETALEAVR
jgi:2-methylcitrate dehydratase PrpD